MQIETRLQKLGIILLAAPSAIGNFVAGKIYNNILYVSGTYGTIKDKDGVDYIPKPGKLGDDLTIEVGYESARLMMINLVAMPKSVLVDIDRIDCPVKLVGYVNAAAKFRDAPSVLNGTSDLLIAIFGEERGRHARLALYQRELARNAPIAGEVMFRLKK